MAEHENGVSPEIPQEALSKAAEAEEVQVPDFLANPQRTDIFLIGMLFVIFVFGIVLIPLRTWLLNHPWAYTLLVGGYTSSVLGGANASVGDGPWWGYWLCTLVGALKFMPFYYWMGRRWGMDFIDLSTQYTPRVQRLARRALASRRAQVFTSCLVPVGYCPGPIPTSIVNGLLGFLRQRAWLTALLNICSLLAVNGVFIALGWTFGTEVLAVVQLINKYLLWFTLALIGLAFFQAWRGAKKNGK
ncbi:membrane protein DedA, SNARE-associated domain [Actinobaculum suis]|uniref:Membrane protein DedA, SNARE-associated domain n=1 Tax=Actinobaculum suis TaxID=1657 RepID=A0A1G7B463_9ACTO|nr:hypothetical protein [Actinobaculum suis]MDY5153672.1 hypothetical protein [Actinobaculum suis]SDE21894.1 membrane protein DedA, SNARE-associated domain [Actinobaculum suis]